MTSSSKACLLYYKALINYVDSQLKLHAERILARYYSSQSGSFQTLTFADIDRMSINLACQWSELIKEVHTISYIDDHSVAYLVVILAAMRLKKTLFLISPRNSQLHVTELLRKTGSNMLVTGKKYEAISQHSAAQAGEVHVLTITETDFDKWIHQSLEPKFKDILNLDFSDNDIESSALIVHSSGTSSSPKPIYLSNRYLFYHLNQLYILIKNRPHLPQLGLEDVMLPIVPLFHCFGFFVAFTMISVGGSIVFMEKLPPSQNEINSALQINKVTMLCCPPIILEEMIPYLEQTNKFDAVQRLKYVLFGGAPLKLESGEWLRSHKINVRNTYGSTEMNGFLSSNLDPNSKTWNSLAPFRLDPHGESYGIFETADESQPDIKHLYVRADCPTLATNICNRPDGGYDTDDLFREDPESPGYYIYLGRRNETLIMENGEKTNPLPMEATIRESIVVKQVIVLGHERKCTSALIELDATKIENLQEEEVIESVYEAIELANRDCPSHSRILLEMVKVLPLGQTIPTTDKGSIKRKNAEQMYQHIIDELYDSFLNGSYKASYDTQSEVYEWTTEEMNDFLETNIAQVLRISKSLLKDHSQSIFDLGFNSLYAIQLRNYISKRFSNVSHNFLFENPTIDSMRKGLLQKEQPMIYTKQEKSYQNTQKLVTRYIEQAREDFDPIVRTNHVVDEQVVLLTGATGSLGSFILECLLKDPRVKKVYCCVRGKQEDLKERLANSFKSRLLDATLLNSERVKVLPMKFNEQYLGLGETRYHALRKEITVIQHCGWLLNFNMSLDHFDKECISPFYNLLKFAYHQQNPIHVHFVSSVSAGGLLGDTVEEEPYPFDARIALPLGYAQSKFVVESLLNFMAKELNFPCFIERLGQVCGDTKNGIWNTSEQYPLMFIGGGSWMHKMPRLETSIDWIPVDFAAAAIVDIMLNTRSPSTKVAQYVYHIVSPQTLKWCDILQSLTLAGMSFEVVDVEDWIKELIQSEENPAYRLIPFFEGNLSQTFKMPKWKTDKTMQVTAVLSHVPALDVELFTKFLANWESTGFYNPSL
ncbi:hypothetical protein EDC96DRAFT_553792 [Choanephora cucurbitarum]|nr:hypothetical protein EDC96DRAFT_553792 [Choanephora cucurbitarum]